MKLLIINDNLLEGGAEIYVKNLIKILLDKKHDVRLITFDNDFESKIEKYDINHDIIINIKHNKLDKIKFHKKLYLKLRQYIDEFSPDKIIVNNLFASPFTQYRALEGYDAYQVVHDYHFICPKSTCIKSDYEICSGYKENCFKNCKYHNSKILLKIKEIQTQRLEDIRKKYIKIFISPSDCLKKYLYNYGYNVVCINNPVDVDKFKYVDYKKINELRIYTYVGMINERKGIFKFLDAFKDFSLNNNVILNIIGKCSTENDEIILNKYLNNKKINYIGKISNDEVLSKLYDSNFLIVPSLWMENYPTTVIEGMLTKNLILGSNRGGIPEMLINEQAMIFDILNKNSILNVLDKSYKIDEKSYNEMLEKNYNFAKENNNGKNYYNKLMIVISGDNDEKN